MTVTVSNVVVLRPGRGPEDELPDLVPRLREADPEAVASVYRRHHAEVRAFARRMLGDAAAAEDVVHDVFVALPDAASRFRGESSLRTLLLSIAVNRCRRWVRSAVRRRQAMSRLEAEPPAAGAASPEAELGRQRLAARLREALVELPVDQREAFVLCTVEERTSPEAAVILDVPEATVRTRLFHARRKLRALLGEEERP